ncbi:DUF3168 domain-containing protein [uncultured Brevundimonas sp.]|uniref:DUF3168 domain-containing protein n=1 Tax=uncultured Brevundimonas sp. TaxID=213418 RepID=UPI002637C93F|nr:DUF3168 domain-containing protein [uncultured Brevundimonas sp.]
MKDPQVDLQPALVAAARASAAVGAVIGTGEACRFYDRAPANPTYPMATLGPMQTVPDYTGCGALPEVFVQIDCWSTAVGFREARTLARALAQALDAALTVTGWTVAIHAVQSIDTRREADNLTSRAILRLRYVLRPAA